MAGIFSKLFLFALNLVVFVIGLAVIVLAALVLSNSSEFETLLQEGTFSVPIVLMMLGILVMLLGFFGCFGALRQSPCLLYTYASMVLILLLGQVSVALYGIVYREELGELIAEHMVLVFEQYGGEDQDISDAINAAQHTLECCGVYNYTDYFSGVINTTHSLVDDGVPYGCCKNTNDSFCLANDWSNATTANASQYIFTQGCYTTLIDLVEEQVLWMGIAAAAMALIQMLCVVIACGIGKKAGQKSA